MPSWLCPKWPFESGRGQVSGKPAEQGSGAWPGLVRCTSQVPGSSDWGVCWARLATLWRVKTNYWRAIWI